MLPCEYVRALIEVKSTFDSAMATKATNHLYDLESLLNGVDEPTTRYKRYLPENVILSTVFFLNPEFRTQEKPSINLTPLSNCEDI